MHKIDSDLLRNLYMGSPTLPIPFTQRKRQRLADTVKGYHWCSGYSGSPPSKVIPSTKDFEPCSLYAAFIQAQESRGFDCATNSQSQLELLPSATSAFACGDLSLCASTLADNEWVRGLIAGWAYRTIGFAWSFRKLGLCSIREN